MKGGLKGIAQKKSVTGFNLYGEVVWREESRVERKEGKNRSISFARRGQRKGKPEMTKGVLSKKR